AREAEAKTARMAGAAVALFGVLSAGVGVLASAPQFVVEGVGLVIGGWLIAVGGMLGLYFCTFSWIVFMLYTIRTDIGWLNGRMLVFYNMAVPSLVLGALWFALPARVKGGSGQKLRNAYGFDVDGEFVDQSREGAS